MPHSRSVQLSLVLAAAAALSTSGCSASSAAEDDEELAIDQSEAAIHSAPGRSVLGVRFRGLEALGAGYVYEGWLIVDGQPVSAGRFSLTQPNAPLFFSGPSAQLRKATAYVLTIEPKTGDDPAPSKVHVLAGDVSRPGALGHASLTTSHPAALGTDFLSAAGGYILETPTTKSVAGDYAQGVWFIDPSKGPGASLTLPVLPDGWIYEGWVVTAAGPLSTGRFKVATGADSDGAGPSAGPDGSPPFPGQDFVRPPTDLIGGQVVVSVEPEMDDSPAPFAIKPLMDAAVEDVGPGTVQPLANIASKNNPRGIAVIF